MCLQSRHQWRCCAVYQVGETVSDIKIEYRKLEALKPLARNARTHSRRQIRQIADSIDQFGFNNPVLIDGEDRIIAGHGRVEGAKLLGLAEVPTVRLDHLSEVERRAYILADNKLAENAGWDREILAIELQHLLEIETEFDLTITGFATAEIDLVIESLGAEADDRADEIPALDSNRPAVSRNGDLWLLGEHRLMCGDAREAGAFERLLGGERAQMVFIDPPYNVKIDGHVCGAGRIKHREFPMAAGEMSEDEFTGFLATTFRHLAAHSIDGAIHFVCMDWRHLDEALSAGRAAYSEVKNLCVWVKDNGGMGSLYRSQHELVLVFKSGTAPHINNVELGRYGRNRTNVWQYPGMSSLGAEDRSQLALHPTLKPVALVADAIKDCSHRGGLILDCFTGGGTTVIAAEKVGRRALAMELDPHYVDVAIRRWQDWSGDAAVHTETGQPFDVIAEERAGAGRTEALASCAKHKETTDAK